MIGKPSEFRARLLKWYAHHRRDLPWRPSPDAPRGARVDPYHVLVSELMLQQTQVATVIPYYRRFLERFPTVQSLAEADEQDVLRLWQGLGYYSRARNLHRAAKTVVSELKGKFPQNAQLLRELSGVGRYTAGAVASIAFDEPAPIVDGNVARVLARVDQIEKQLDRPEVRDQLWARAEELVVGERPGDFNSAMMELGAMVCVPRGPKCLVCPVAKHCEALAAGLQEKLPLPKKRAATPLLRRDVICVTHKGKWLIEQRPAKGRWASMWQFVTVQANGKKPRAAEVIGCEVKGMKRLGLVTHGLTHRRYEFAVYACERSGRGALMKGERVWVELEELGKYPVPRPHLKVAEMLRAAAG
jgi:A/G-specific adenine glycosylase